MSLHPINNKQNACETCHCIRSMISTKTPVPNFHASSCELFIAGRLGEICLDTTAARRCIDAFIPKLYDSSCEIVFDRKGEGICYNIRSTMLIGVFQAIRAEY